MVDENPGNNTKHIENEEAKNWKDKGNQFFYLDQYTDALECYDAAIKIDLQYASAWNNRGTTLLKLDRYEEAITSYDKALEIDPGNPEVWYNRGIELFKLGRYEDAIASYDKALEINPGDSEVRYNRSAALRKVAEGSGDKTKPIENEEAKNWKDKGNQFFYQDKYTSAIECYDVAIKIDHRYANAWNNRGFALLKLDRYEEAIASYDKALEIDPGDPEVWYNRGIALFNLNRYEDAIASYDKALEINPGDSEVRYNRSAALNKIGRPSDIESDDTIIAPQQKEIFRSITRKYDIESNNNVIAPQPSPIGRSSEGGDSASSQPIPEEQERDTTKKLCPKCGTTHTPSKTFCRICGTPLSSQPLSEDQKSDAPNKTCPRCDTVLKPGVKFCSLCGHQFSSEMISNEDLPNRIASVEQKASALSQFRDPVQVLITNAREQYRAGAYDAARTTITGAEDAIPTLAQCESQLKQWGKDRYTTTPLRSMRTENIYTITTAFQDFERGIATLEQLGRRVEDIKRSFSQGNGDPVILQRITVIASQLHDPCNIPGIEKEIEAVQQIPRDQQEKSRQPQDMGQLFTRLQAKAEKLTRYAPLVTGPLKNAEVQNTAGQFDEGTKTLQAVEGTIDTLLEDEASLESWKTKGYDTTGLETLQPENAGEVIAAFRQYNQAICRLETIEKELASKKGTYPQLVEQTGTSNLVLSIERDLNDPARLDTVEKNYQQLNNTIRQLEDQLKSTEQNLREQADRVERESTSPTVKREIATITKCIRQQDLPRSMELFKGLAEQQLAQVNTTLATLRADGAVVSTSSESIRQHIETQHYGDAVIGSEKVMAELIRVQELYAKAKVLRPEVTAPVIIALYNSGKYEEFVRASEEQQRLNRKIAELKDNGRKLLGEAEKFGQVPEHVRSQLDATDIPTIQRAITELGAFRTTIKPDLALTLGHTQFIADEWDRLTVQLANRGNAHLGDIRLTFSEEFETKWIKTATVNAGVTTTLDIAIRPKLKGKVPLEVTALYRDGNDKEYRETHEFWIEVVEKSMTATSGTHTTPAGQFTSGTATQKQLPEDLSDRYTESEFIGKGGFARVFKAKRKDGKYVAVKIPITLDATTGKSFIAEMQNWTRLNHPNIVKLYDFNIMPMAYFEEELCDSALADQKKPIENEEAAWVLFNICEGLKFAHGLKIIHRDLKPQNILLKNGVPKISDWGLSKVISESTSTTITSFTPFYAAPEQIKNQAKDERTDIWQLGVILYELITGMLPFKGESMFEIGMSIATKDPQCPGEIQPDAKVIESVVMKCLQKEPEKRYQSVLELQKDLAMYLRNNYAELLSTSVNAQDYTRSASFCGDLVMINMVTGDIATAYKYILDLVQYTKGNVKIEAQELSDQLKMRMEMGVTEIPAELIQKADLIVHQVNTGYRKRE